MAMVFQRRCLMALFLVWSGLLPLVLSLLPGAALGFFPDRRESKADDEFGWLVAPTPVSIAGVGSALPVFGLLSNVYRSTDVIATQTLMGDFEMRVMLVDQLPLFTEHLLLSGGEARQHVPFKSYNRGIDSDPEEFLIPVSRATSYFGQLKLMLFEKRFEGFYNRFHYTGQLEKIFDADGNEFSNVDTEEREESGDNYGVTLDLTDSYVDPRKGIRLGWRRLPNTNQDPDLSDYYVTDSNLTVYIPMFGEDTLVFNHFESHATVTRQGVVDETELHRALGLGCVPGSPIYDACMVSENARVAQRLSLNRYGTAGSLGGPNRLMAYDLGRFRAGHALHQAVEYRLNLTTVESPINWFVVGGIKSSLQIAFFAEQGSVNDESARLRDTMKTSWGMGLRTIISGLVYRLDIAAGDEGVRPVLFIFYPFDLKPIVNG